MQVTETLSEGLKREFKVVVPAAELDAKVNVRLGELKDRVRINGFRPGKVPVAHLKRVYGRSAMAEVIEATVRDANNQIVSERGYKLAADRAGRRREIDRRRERPRLHHGGRNRAADRTHRFQDHQAHQADQRDRRRRGGRGAHAHHRAEQAL
jgi:hypothetical protein